LAYSLSPIGAPLGSFTAEDTNCNATPNNNVRSGATTLYNILVDNSLNAAVTYLQIFNNVGPTVGTTQADMTIMVPAGYVLPIPLPQGVAFGTGLSFCATTTPHGNTNPASACKVYLTVS